MDDFSLDDAIREDVARWPHSQESLSRVVCGSAQGLRHKLVHFKGQHLRPEELVMLQLSSGGRHTVSAMARELGGAFLMLPPTEVCLDNQDLLVEANKIHAALGTLLTQMNEFIQNDGQIDEGEKAKLDAQGHAAYVQILRFLSLTYRVYGTAEVVKTAQ
ncbi:phage regulatory CII family protein [Pseudogulbenkiania ferrooxidans]|uniref:Uncharacterized protein n=1 Tax=Pseudogulbenkiania ferrooxidans EGD-HP2 TaxID=1388764 RepID=A0ABN0N7Q5_9NEIS|nr:phage regulatory CII family protein [Pseudogulbenkiania ferrooxidans]ERE07201.1 hypothetical protein O166_06455 [Pseudogulbenkiania ferrooxidans EGD-HP2]